MLSSKRLNASSLNFCKHYATKARSKSAKRHVKLDKKSKRTEIAESSAAIPHGEATNGEESNFTKKQLEQAELASYSRKLALAAGSLKRAMDQRTLNISLQGDGAKQPLQSSTSSHSSASPSHSPSTSSNQSKASVLAENDSNLTDFGRKKAKKGKKSKPTKHVRLRPSFVVEMDPLIENSLKSELGVDTLSQSRDPDPIKRSSRNSFQIGRRFELVPRPMPKSSDVSQLGNAEPVTEEQEPNQTENASSSPQSLRMAALETELAGLGPDVVVKQPSADLEKRRLGKKRAAQMSRILDSVPIWSWRKINRERKRFAGVLEDWDKIVEMRKQGKRPLPVRPPSMSRMLDKEMAEETKLLETLSLKPGVLPRSLLTMRVATRIPQSVIEVISTRFLQRRTSGVLLALLVLAFLVYEGILLWHEWHYTKHPETLRHTLGISWEANGSWLAAQERLLSETQLIEHNRTLTWHQIEYGWLPDSIWRWWMRAKDANQDPLIYTLLSIIKHSKAYFHTIKASFFINNSRFWAAHAMEANADTILLNSLNSNQQLHPTLRTLHIPSFMQTIDNDHASRRLIEHDAIAMLLRSSILSGNFSSHSLEVQMAQNLLKNRKRVDIFWKMPEDHIIATLESLLMHADENPFFVSIALSALVQHAPPRHSAYVYTLVSSTLSALSDQSRHGMEVVTTITNFASLHWRSLKHGISDDLNSNEAEMLKTAKGEYLRLKQNTKHVTTDEVKMQPPAVWWALSAPFMAGYIWMRYDSNALWNGLGSLPIRVRKLVTIRRAGPAAIGSILMMSLLNLKSRHESGIADYLAGFTFSRQEAPKGQENSHPIAASLDGTKTGPSPTRRAIVSLFVGSALLPLQITFAHFFPFTLVPTYIIPNIMLHPVSWWRKWSHTHTPNAKSPAESQK